MALSDGSLGDTQRLYLAPCFEFIMPIINFPCVLFELYGRDRPLDVWIRVGRARVDVLKSDKQPIWHYPFVIVIVGYC